jgi:RNA polymerase sigma factor (TIGR02999 family)
MSDVTQILSQIEQGDPHAPEKLLPLIYDELRKIAAAKLASEKPGQTLQATALVHEAYLRLVSDLGTQHWNSRGHFFGAAAEAMRRVLVEAARAKGSLKRGGDRGRIEMPAVAQAAGQDPLDLLALDEALTRLEQEHPDYAQIVKLRFFAGLNLDDAASAAGISRATVERRWAYARAWLYGQLQGRIQDSDSIS